MYYEHFFPYDLHVFYIITNNAYIVFKEKKVWFLNELNRMNKKELMVKIGKIVHDIKQTFIILK